MFGPGIFFFFVILAFCDKTLLFSLFTLKLKFILPRYFSQNITHIHRVVNMELLQTFAPDVWLLYNKELEEFKGQLDTELEALRKEAEMVRMHLQPTGGATEMCTYLVLLSYISLAFKITTHVYTQTHTQINLSRKIKQDEVAPRLTNLVRKRDETLYTNLELNKACAMLQGEIKRLRIEAAAAGAGAQNNAQEEEDEENLDG